MTQHALGVLATYFPRAREREGVRHKRVGVADIQKKE